MREETATWQIVLEMSDIFGTEVTEGDFWVTFWGKYGFWGVESWGLPYFCGE